MTKELIKFIMVGLSNTVIGIILIFLFYNVMGFGYWISTGLGYFIGSVWAYFAGRTFVFQYNKKEWKTVPRFALNVAVCYFMAYSIARPIVLEVCSFAKPQLSTAIKEKISIIIGMGIYTLLNFLGQKFICFRKIND